jgi:acyl-CoA thioester hydrolase
VTRSEWCDLEYRGGLPVPATAIGLSAGLTTDLPAHGAPRGLDIYAPRPSPTPDEAEDLGLVTIYRGTVTDELCDSLGYMLPRYVIGRISDGIPNLLAQTSGHDRSNGKIGGAALEYRLIYRSPVHAGDIIVLRSGLRSVSSKTYVWCHWLFNAETGECCATAEAVAISMDLEARKAIEIPPAMHERLTSLIVPGLSL